MSYVWVMKTLRSASIYLVFIFYSYKKSINFSVYWRNPKSRFLKTFSWNWLSSQHEWDVSRLMCFFTSSCCRICKGRVLSIPAFLPFCVFPFYIICKKNPWKLLHVLTATNKFYSVNAALYINTRISNNSYSTKGLNWVPLCEYLYWN